MSVADGMSHDDYIAAIRAAERAGIKDMSRAEWDAWFTEWMAGPTVSQRAAMVRRMERRNRQSVLVWGS